MIDRLWESMKMMERCSMDGWMGDEEDKEEKYLPRKKKQML